MQHFLLFHDDICLGSPATAARTGWGKSYQGTIFTILHLRKKHNEEKLKSLNQGVLQLLDFSTKSKELVIKLATLLDSYSSIKL
jgi:hypothetical protein